MVLSHTAGESQDDARLAGLILRQVAQSANDALFRMFPNRAGVQQDDIRAIWRRRGFVALRFNKPRMSSRVSDIHLTAVGLNIDAACFPYMMSESSPRTQETRE